MEAMEQPADTRTMVIAHRALRRDLGRVRAAVTGDSPPGTEQRRALGEHVVWLMHFLHQHHTGEDEGLWPLVRARNPAAGPLLDVMDADHRRIEPAVAGLREAGRAYAGSSAEETRSALVRALDTLEEVLVPHLDREERERLPVVEASVGAGEWNDYEQTHHVKTKSLWEKGIEGHWLIDDLDPAGYDLVVHLVPPIPRFVLLKGFAGVYRRQAAARWTSAVPTTPRGAGPGR